ncbi:unnamed protein product [Linum tenue]|uniref:HMA domain-containing protein n=1 Tax=Linum tenue TaxID=586396 RepID=A0AAV0GPC5_9ROSI|nr:unnamed protein product [Linum tenue]
MGEEKKEEEKKGGEEEEGKKKEEEKKQDGGGEEKKEEEPPQPPPEIVLKVDMHCEACARKVARALKGFQGVEEVSADSKTSRVVVKGKTADPLKVWERLQKKSGRKVELISPLPKPPEEKPKEEEPPKEDPPKEPEKKDEPPPVITVVLKIRMHCEACAQGLQKRIRKISGVESVETDMGNGTVTVKGVVEAGKLAEDVYKKTRKQVSIVIKEEEKKEAEEKKEEKEEEKKKEEEEKKTTEGEQQQEGEEGKSEIKRSEYWPSTSRNYSMEYYSYPPPQIFSDENPNACSLM